MSNADVEGSGPNLEISINHAEDEAAHDGHSTRPAQRD